MSVRDDDDRAGVRRRARPRAGSSRPRATSPGRRTCGCWPRSRGSTGARAPLLAGDPRTAGGHDAAGVPRRRRLLGVLPPALHGARSSPRSGRATRRSRSTTPRATCSRSSQHHGMLGVFGSPQWRTVTGGSREYVARVAAGARRGPHRHQGHLGARDRRPASRSPTATARSRRTTRSWSPPTRARRSRCWPSRPPPSARCSARCPTRRTPRCCTPTPRCCRGPRDARASWNFLRPPRRPRGARHGHLRPDPAAAARHRHPLPRHPRRRGPRRPGDRDRPDGVRAPALHPASVAAQRRLPERRHRPDRLRRRLPRLGLPRGRRALRRSPPPSTSGCAWPTAPEHAARRRDRACTTHDDPAHPPHARSGAPSSTARTPGWSTSTTCPTTALPAGPLRGPRPPRRPATATIRANVDGVPRRARHRPDRRPGPDGRARRGRFGYCFNPISVFWCFDRDRRARRPPWSRCTTPTATGTPTSSTPTSGAARAPTRRCTSRRSTAPTALRPRRPGPRRPAARRGHAAHRRRRGLQRVPGRTPYRRARPLAAPRRPPCAGRS